LAACSRMSTTDFLTTDSIPMASNRQADHHLRGVVTITGFAPQGFAKPTLRATTFVNFLQWPLSLRSAGRPVAPRWRTPAGQSIMLLEYPS
jgi:hypothetical protein